MKYCMYPQEVSNVRIQLLAVLKYSDGCRLAHFIYVHLECIMHVGLTGYV